MVPKKSNRVPAVDRAIDLIDLMAASEKDLSLSEIMERVKIPRQSLIRTLNTLCDRGIIDKTGKRGVYRLGIKLLYLGNRLQDKIKLRSVAWPVMQELAQETHKTIELATIDRDQLILIEQIEGSEGLRLYSRVGSVYPYFHAVSAGKIYLAHMEPEKRRKVLQKIGLPAVTEHTITDMKKLEDELAEVQVRGYAFEDQELRKGVRRVAAPIYDYYNNLAGCIGISASIFSFEWEDKEELGKRVIDSANKISYKIGNKKEDAAVWNF